MNMTLDGFCDHTYGVADEELHWHYTHLLRDAGALLYGRTTYQMMENFWPTLVENPSGDKSMDEFAFAINDVPKVVFSRTLTSVGWKNAVLAKRSLEEEVQALRQQPGKDIFVGSPSLIAGLTRLDLVDEFQLTVHPVIAGSGLVLFKGVTDMIMLKLLKTKPFGSGAITQYYERVKK